MYYTLHYSYAQCESCHDLGRLALENCNLGEDAMRPRDIIIKSGVVETIKLTQKKHASDSDVQREANWALGHICVHT